jgi:hypothetical protein
MLLQYLKFIYESNRVGNQLNSTDATGSFCCIELVTFIKLFNINDVHLEAYNATDIWNSI